MTAHGEIVGDAISEVLRALRRGKGAQYTAALFESALMSVFAADEDGEVCFGGGCLLGGGEGVREVGMTLDVSYVFATPYMFGTPYMFATPPPLHMQT